MSAGAHPFSSPWQITIDAIRLVNFVIALIISTLCVRIVVATRRRHLSKPGTRAVLAVAAMTVSATYSSLSRLGLSLSPLLPINVITLVTTAELLRYLLAASRLPSRPPSDAEMGNPWEEWRE